MSKHILEVLFESKVKLKILKFLFRHEEISFSLKELAGCVQEPQDKVLEELNKLQDIGLVGIKRT